MILLYIILAILLVFVILIIVAPKTFNVHRSVIIDKPLPEVFQYLKHIKTRMNGHLGKRKTLI